MFELVCSDEVSVKEQKALLVSLVALVSYIFVFDICTLIGFITYAVSLDIYVCFSCDYKTFVRVDNFVY